MNNVGKSIRLFLVDGSPQGLMTLEVVNWTGHVLMGPRTQIANIIQREEASRTGVYILIGSDENDPNLPKVYIGESDNVRARLTTHNNDEAKDFWDRVCIVTNKDLNLTKAHVKYLESRLIAIAYASGKTSLMNSTAPKYDGLSESDRADMEYFISQMQLVLPVLGLEIFRDTQRANPQSNAKSLDTENKGVAEIPNFEILNKNMGIHALARQEGGEFILQLGSSVRASWVGTASENSGYARLHDRLILDGKILVPGGKSVGHTTEDIYFKSPSAAAAVVYGRASNGRIEWKQKGTNRTYADWQEKQTQEILDASKSSLKDVAA